jgi:hypothetical protein
MALLLLLLALPLAALVQTAQAFETENGYDLIGTDPICFTSTRNVTNRIAGGLLPSPDLNNEVFAGQSSSFELLSSCFEGTDLDIEPLDLGVDRKLEIGSTYTVRVTVEVLLSQISDKIPQLSNSTIYVRFLLCNRQILGFCSPLQGAQELVKDLVPSETDFDADETDSFEDGANEWLYEPGKVLLGISHGPIVLTGWVKWTLSEVDTNSNLYKTSIDITMQLPNGIQEGAYSFIGHVVMNFDIGDNITERVDIADAIPDIEVQNPPTIRYVRNSTKIIVGVAIGIFGSFALFCFGFIIYYRANPVMKLAQAPFLAALAGCCLVGIVFTFTFLPTHDVFCRLRGPMILIPLTTAAAIMVARTWRIYVTLSAALSLGRQGKKGERLAGTDLGQRLVMLLSFLSQLYFLLCQNPCKKRSSTTRRRIVCVPSLRQAVTAEETTCLIAILSFPQVFLQIFAVFYYDRKLEFDLDEHAHIGRWTCTAKHFTGGFLMALFIILLVVAVSWTSRSLPSAFNENDQLFRAATSSAIFSSVVAALETVADSLTDSPDLLVSIRYFHSLSPRKFTTNKCSVFIVQMYLRSSFSIGISVSVLVIVIWPKIRRVLSCEKVVISRLLGNTMATPESKFTLAGQNAILQNSNRITTVKRDDPIPVEVEIGILAMEERLRGVANDW